MMQFLLPLYVNVIISLEYYDCLITILILSIRLQ